MAITGGVEFVKKNTTDTRTLEQLLQDQNNVVDLEGKVPNLDKNAPSNINEVQINAYAEKDFDNFILQNQSTVSGFIQQKTYETAGKSWIETNFRTFLNSPKSLLDYHLQQAKNIEITEVIKGVTFELNDLWSETQLRLLQNNIVSSTTSSPSGERTTDVTGTDKIDTIPSTIPNSVNIISDTNNPTSSDISSPSAGKKSRGRFDGNTTAGEHVYSAGGHMSNAHTAEYYANIDFEEESDLNPDQEKKALKRLLKGKSEALDIVDRDYKRSGADKAATGTLLRVLLRIGGKKLNQEIDEDKITQALETVIKAYNNGQRFAMDKGWKKRAKAYGDRDLYKLGALYQISAENQQGFPYLQRVMGLFVQEFVREQSGYEAKSMTEIYNEHNDMPTSRQLNLVTRRGKAIRSVEGANAHQRQEIRKLLRLAEEVEINALITYAPTPTEDSPTTSHLNTYVSIFTETQRATSKTDTPRGSLTPKEKQFIKLFQENKGDEIFESVLEGLLAGMTIQDIANAGRFEIPPSSDEKIQEKGFVMRFADLNFDGKVDFGDKGMVGGLQFESIYREVATRMHYENQAHTQALTNILEFGLHIAKGMGNQSFAKKISELLAKDNFGWMIANDFFNDKTNIPVLKFLQNAVMMSPLPVADILAHGKDAYQHFYDNSLEFSTPWKDKVNRHVTSQLTAQGINPDIDFDPITREGIVQAVTSFVTTQSTGAGIGTSIDLDKILSGLSINVGVAATEHNNGVVGLHLARNKSMAVSDTTSLYGGVSSGGNFAEGFVPLWTLSVGAGAEQRINQKRVEKSLNPTSAKKIALGGNITLINYVIPSRGVNLGYSVDKMQGIERQYDHIKRETKAIVKASLRSIKDISDQQASISIITKELSTKYADTTPEMIRKAAWNIYRGLLAYNQKDLSDPIISEQVSTMMAEYYALAWRNAAVTGLKGRSFDSASIGIQVFANFLPIPTASIQWAKYKNLYYDATPQSLDQAKKTEATGDGNEWLSKTIGEKEIAYINNTIENTFRNQKSKLNDTDNQAPDLLLDPTNNTIKIPFALWEKGIINICIDPCLKKHIAQENINNQNYLIIPSEIPMRLRSNHTAYASTYVLNLGDVKSDGGKKTVDSEGKVKFEDLTLRTGVRIPAEWFGDPTQAVFEKSTKVTDIDSLINRLNVGDYASFPLLNAQRSTETGKETQTVFTLRPQTNGQPAYDIAGSTTGLVLAGTTLTLVPQTGELIVNYDKTSNSYLFSYQAEPRDKLKISYKINERTASETDEVNRGNEKKIDFNTVKLFDFVSDSPLYKAEALIISLVPKLKDAEKRNITAFKNFLLHLWKIDDESTIDGTELNNAKKELTTILGAKHDIITFITDNANDNKVIAYVMDRLKQIFAMEGGYENATIAQLWTRRGDWYKTKCSSPSGQHLPDSIVREDLLPGPGTTIFNIKNVQEKPNLIGYTAFYRDKKNPAYSLTAPGKTTVYSNFISEPLSGDKLADGKKWFLVNLDVQTYEKELLLEALQGHIPTEYRDQITTDNIMDFLRTGELLIDNGQKKYKMTLNASYHFYLLGECVNESLGMQINSISIQEFVPRPGTTIDSTGEVAHSYDNANMGLVINSNHTRGAAQRGKKAKIGGGVAFGVAKSQDIEPPINRGQTEPDPNGIGFGNTQPE